MKIIYPKEDAHVNYFSFAWFLTRKDRERKNDNGEQRKHGRRERER